MVRRTLKVMPTEYMLGVLIRERIIMDCSHRYFYADDSDSIYRCSDCGVIVDPDEVESALEEPTIVEDPDNE